MFSEAFKRIHATFDTEVLPLMPIVKIRIESYRQVLNNLTVTLSKSLTVDRKRSLGTMDTIANIRRIFDFVVANNQFWGHSMRCTCLKMAHNGLKAAPKEMCVCGKGGGGGNRCIAADFVVVNIIWGVIRSTSLVSLGACCERCVP